MFFKGDIILSKSIDPSGRVAIDKLIEIDLWTYGIIPYKLDANIPNKQRILDVMEHWEIKTSIRFIEINETTANDYPNHVKFVYNKNIPNVLQPVCASV
jgi:hypothetical protein